MIQEKLFEATHLPLLVKGMDAYSLRHRAIADNVANAETSRYRRREVEFEEKLRLALRGGQLLRTDPQHIGRSGVKAEELQPELRLDPKESDVNDLNNVDIDREMAELAQNQLQHNFASHLAKMYFEMLQLSIRGL